MKHGATKGRRPTAEYRIYCGIVSRARGTAAKRDYADRGISMCDRWADGQDGLSGFECFLADMGPRPSPAHSVEREDNEAGYTPANCRWATRSEQARNKRTTIRVTFRGRELPLIEAWELAGKPVKYLTLRKRLELGWALEDALSTATGRHGPKVVYRGESMRPSEAWAKAGRPIPYLVFWKRVFRHGWSVDEALSTPLVPRGLDRAGDPIGRHNK